jgi:hypothetical protein
MDKTFQRGDQGPFGVAYKLLPMTDEAVENQINCFVVNGTSADNAVTAQSVLPDLDGFALKGDCSTSCLDDDEGNVDC